MISHFKELGRLGGSMSNGEEGSLQGVEKVKG